MVEVTNTGWLSLPNLQGTVPLICKETNKGTAYNENLSASPLYGYHCHIINIPWKRHLTPSPPYESHLPGWKGSPNITTALRSLLRPLPATLPPSRGANQEKMIWAGNCRPSSILHHPLRRNHNNTNNLPKTAEKGHAVLLLQARGQENRYGSTPTGDPPVLRRNGEGFKGRADQREGRRTLYLFRSSSTSSSRRRPFFRFVPSIAGRGGEAGRGGRAEAGLRFFERVTTCQRRTFINKLPLAGNCKIKC